MIDRQSFNSIVQYITNLAVAMFLMIWGTMNFVTNIAFLFRSKAEPSWLAMLFLVLLFSIVPFSIGVWLATRTLRNKD